MVIWKCNLYQNNYITTNFTYSSVLLISLVFFQSAKLNMYVDIMFYASKLVLVHTIIMFWFAVVFFGYITSQKVFNFS